MERPTALGTSFLHLEKPDSPMHVAGVLVLEPPVGGLEAIAVLVEARLPLVPRYAIGSSRSQAPGRCRCRARGMRPRAHG